MSFIDNKVYPSSQEIPYNIREIGLAGDAILDVFQNQTRPNFIVNTSTHIEFHEPEELNLEDLLEPKPVEDDYRIWPRYFNPEEMYDLSVSKPTHTIVAVKDTFSNKIKDFEEVFLPEIAYASDETTSILRQPGQSKDFVRGNSQQFPFLPGGLEKTEEYLFPHKQEDVDLRDDILYTVPPGFDRGLSDIKEEKLSEAVIVGENPSNLLAPYKVQPSELVEEEQTIYKDEVEVKKSNAVKLDDIFKNEDLFQTFETMLSEATKRVEKVKDEPVAEEVKETQQIQQTVTVEEKKPRKKTPSTIDDLDDLLLEDIEFIVPEETKPKTEYAIMTRIDVSNFKEMVPEMAIQYPFDLDVFQKEAIYHLENNESVFVSAHTSAGKTVVAEYAIALGQKHLTRVIYTSPIKTLSNQKFREFKETFGDVGILTGDVQINPTATCLIMTTEILRSMLYKGADLIRDVEWVIFDEVHYINDPERGVVWEEVIIMLPDHINMIFLSATIPNTYEFADWIGRTKKKPIYVITTDKRPVPLEHHLYYNGDIFKIVDKTPQFLNVGYRSAIQASKEKDRQGKFKSGYSRARAEKNQWVKLIEILERKKLLPTIVFSFSRNKCEEIANSLGTVDLTTSSEKNEIHIFFNKAVARLTGTDKELPQVLNMKELLKRGIGVHHSGLLPIVKEMVEMLFQRGLVKVLYATETFAMGVNMPARTVIFNGLRKHDGTQFRELTAGEYIQMSGRAGRRGIDNVGMVMITCWNEIPEEHILQTLILGEPTKLESQFRLTYNMILNLLRVETFRVEDMIKRSFSESKNQRYLQLQEMLSKANFKIPEVEDMEPGMLEYYKASKELEKTVDQMQSIIFTSGAHSPFLHTGRVVSVRTREYGITLGAVIRTVGAKEAVVIVLKILVPQRHIMNPSENCLPAYSSFLIPEKDFTDIIQVPLTDILSITQATIEVRQNLKKPTDVVGNALISLWSSYPQEGPPALTPKDLRINLLDFIEMYQHKLSLLREMKQSSCWQSPKLAEQYIQIDKVETLKEKIAKIQYALSDQNLELMPEFQKRLKVLEILKYVDSDGTVQLKGRVACEVNSSDELLVTEMIFENFFTPLTPEECVSVLSCLICQSDTEIPPQLTDRLQEQKEKLINLALSLGKLQMEMGLDTTPTEYLNTLKFSMMQVAYEWARGVPFAEITKLTDIQEGSIVRSITQIDQACREVRNAARVIGDSALYQKMEEASRLIKRDIVFAASLYVV